MTRNFKNINCNDEENWGGGITLVSDLGGLEGDTTTLCADGEYGQNLPCKTPKRIKMLDTDTAKYLTCQD